MKTKKTIKRLLTPLVACMLSLVMVIAFVGCNPASKDPTVESVTLDVNTVTLAPSDTQRLTATVLMSDGTEGSVDEWTTSDVNVATVTKGVILAKAAGTATITAKAGDKEANCVVTVEDITVEISKTAVAIEKGETETLTAVVKKDGVELSGETIVWSSSDESIATVDQSGVVTAKKEGDAIIKAQRANGNVSATCAVTVKWDNIPAGYKVVDYYEQNKVPVNTWGYWNDPANYVGGVSTMDEAYTADSSSSDNGAGMASFTFTISERTGEDVNNAIIQITYRSAGEQGYLKTNYDYKLSLKLTSTAAGTIRVNPTGDAPNKNPNEVEIEVGMNEIEVEFRHGDWGTVYPEGNYTNVESAVYLLLGNLGENGEQVTVTVDEIKWTEIGESAVKTVEPNFDGSDVTAEGPDLSTVEAIALNLSSDNAVAGEGNCGNEVYEIADNGEGKSYTVAYSGTWGSTYSHIVVAIPDEADVANNNTFSVKIKNNGESSMTIRFDLAGTAYDNGTNPASRDCALSAIATVGSPNVDLGWDGTALTVGAGVETVLYITYETTSEAGVPAELLVYFDTVYEGTPTEHSGNVTISEFKFANVENGDKPAETPDISDVEAVAIPSFTNSDNASYTVNTTDEGKSYNVTYTDIAGGSYANISADITQLAANCNTFSVKIKNNANTSVTLRIDICGTTAITVGNNTASKDLNLSISATGGTGLRTDSEWDGSFITLAAGEEVVVTVTFESDNTAIGAPAELIIFIDTSTYQDANTYSGNVTFSEFKFANAE